MASSMVLSPSNSRSKTHSSDPLLQDFKGIVAREGDTDYCIERWSALAAQRAAYILYPTDAEDISNAIKFARGRGLPLAIAGGRHNAFGSSSCENGVVIDMRRMNVVRVDKDKMVGYIQGGSTVYHVEQELFKQGLATTTGVGRTVGQVGLTLGGGFGFALGRHGMACDNIVSATMVLASGEIINVNENEHADLLWGIKGGGSNFGVVAELGMRLHVPRQDVHHIECTYLPEKLPEIVEEMTSWEREQTPDETIFVFFALGPQDAKPYIILFGVGIFSADDGERRWARFLRLGPVQHKRNQIPYNKLSTLVDPLCEMPGTKVSRGSHFSSFDYETVKETYDLWLSITEIGPLSNIVYEFYHYDKMASVPVDGTAFAQRSKDKTCYVGCIGFFEKDFIPQAIKLSDKMQASVSASSSNEAQQSIGYINYADALTIDDTTDAHARRAFGSNYPRLQKLKREYDPDMVFNKWFCVRPSEERL